jgi:hypothetical protein
MPLSTFFSFHPFANIGWAIFKLDAVGFPTCEKAHNVAINDTNVFQIQNEIAAICGEFKKSAQLGDRRSFDSAAEDEHGASSSGRCLNPKGHRIRPFEPTRHSRLCRTAYFFFQTSSSAVGFRSRNSHVFQLSVVISSRAPVSLTLSEDYPGPDLATTRGRDDVKITLTLELNRNVFVAAEAYGN